MLGVVADGVVVEVAHYAGLHDVLHHDVLHHYILTSILFYIFNKICPKIYLVFGDKCFMLVLARPLEHNTGYLYGCTQFTNKNQFVFIDTSYDTLFDETIKKLERAEK